MTISSSTFNSLDEHFLISWNGAQNRRNSYEDGVYGTTCPIPPGKNFTYILQVKDQIGSFYYFPFLGFHKAAGGFGGFRILSRPRILVPFSYPAGDYTVLIGDWYKSNHTLDGGKKLPFPDGILINGVDLAVLPSTSNKEKHTGLGYQLLDCKILSISASKTTADQPAKDYYIVVSSRFTTPVLTSTETLRYSNSAGSEEPYSKWTKATRTIILANSTGLVNDKRRYTVNSVSFVPANTPLKLADYFKIDGVYCIGSISDRPTGRGIYLDTSVLNTDYRAFIEIVFQNDERMLYRAGIWTATISSFMDGGQWTPASMDEYNLRDAVSRCTTQSWTAVYVALNNVGMWNLRSENWARRYLGQQFYLRVFTTSTSLRDEYPIPKNALLCGWASGRITRPL
ncbi:SKU5 similar 5 isoform 2 [Hibiscus syriacus]|uniref:SKU5 similar 5 isoform 2 n=1 Tax=Hibiscus syriacus TaxID=106335 RepID=A0A6A3DAP0_HIBSY|nr:SKU5 similar 5 isoform 2 [Hibiscus syriacus]